MKFTIRDLFLVTLVVAMGLGWGLDHARLASQAANWRHCTGALERAFLDLRWTVFWTEDRSEVKVKKKNGDYTETNEYFTDLYEPGTKFYAKTPPTHSQPLTDE